MTGAMVLHAAEELLHAAIADAVLATGLGVLALAMSRLLRGRWPSLGQALWTFVLLRLVLPPGLSHPWSLGALFGLWPGTRAASEGGAFGVPTGLSVEGLRQAAGAPGSDSLGLGLLGLWALVAVALACVDAGRVRACRRLVRAAQEVADPWVASRVAAWREKLGIRRPVRIVAAGASVSPFTMGLLRPVIFIPSVLLEPRRRAALESALAHELAHVTRCDALLLGVERVIRRLYFFHPVAWLAGLRLHDGRERLADGLVVSHGLMGKRDYARGLLDVLQLDLQGVEAPTLHTTEGRVKMRILRILGSGPDRRWQARTRGLAAVAVGAFLLPLGSGSGSPAEAETRAATSQGVAVPGGTAGLANPLPGRRISMGYGQTTHPTKGTPYFHRGVDLVAPVGTGVLAAADGVVETATTRYDKAPDAGSAVVVDHGSGSKTFYAHLGTLLVREGQRVRRGDVVAQVGLSGLTTGPHVHVEVWRDGRHVDPASAVAGLPSGR